MYEEHPLFKQPDRPEATIWRYLSFTKFVSLLDRRALYFARADKLDDPLEGRWNELTTQAVNSFLNALFESLDITEQESRERVESQITEQVVSMPEKQRKVTYLNSWHIGEHESAAMWKMYSDGTDGLAVVSSFSSLTESLSACEDHAVYVGEVTYVDFESAVLPTNNTFGPYLYKRKSFEFENELRALISNLGAAWNAGGVEGWHEGSPDPGLYVPIDLERLIRRVQVSPTAPTWFVELVESVCRQYGCEKPVSRSNLYDAPLA